MKSSPAPWSEFETEDGNFGVRMDTSHEVVFGNLEGSCGICHANARLTKLAPEILDSLERLMEKYNTNQLQPIDWYHAAQVIKRVYGIP